MKAFQAYANQNRATAATPREAAAKFFTDFPTKRKCDVTEGTLDGNFFTVTYNRSKMPLSFKDVTKKKVGDLPDV